MNFSRLAGYNYAAFVFWMLNPYFKWLIPSEIAITFLFVSTLFITLGLNYYRKHDIILSKYKILVAVITLLFMLYLTTPLVHTMRWGHFLSFATMVMLIPLNDKIIYRGYTYLKKIIVIASVFALIYWLLNLLKFQLPYYTYDPPFRMGRQYYRIYGPVVSLYSGISPTGGSLERICALFAEPGHFGLYVGFILAIEKFSFRKKDNIILLIAGVLSFSTAFYGVLLLGVIYKVLQFQINKNDILKTVVAISFLFSILILFVGSEKVSTTLFSRIFEAGDINNVESLIENRARDETKDVFEDFIKHSNKILVGYGYGNIEIQKTNWRGAIYQFGLVGVFLILALILSIVSISQIKYGLLLFMMLILVASHRSFFMFVPVFYLLTFTACSVDNFVKKNRVHRLIL